MLFWQLLASVVIVASVAGLLAASAVAVGIADPELSPGERWRVTVLTVWWAPVVGVALLIGVWS